MRNRNHNSDLLAYILNIKLKLIKSISYLNQDMLSHLVSVVYCILDHNLWEVKLNMDLLSLNWHKLVYRWRNNMVLGQNYSTYKKDCQKNWDKRLKKQLFCTCQELLASWSVMNFRLINCFKSKIRSNTIENFMTIEGKKH